MSTPSISQVIRLSARDREFILMGFSWIGANYQLWQSKKQLPNRRPDRIWRPGFDQGLYAQNMMDRILVLHATISSLTGGGRLRTTTSMEFAACTLAVRVAVMRHRHGHQQLDIARLDTSSTRLLRRLEAARKRAKRAELRQLGTTGYQETAHEWHRFLTWLRTHFLDCCCMRKHRIPSQRYRRVLVTQFTEWARAELIDRKHKVPAEHELRRLVRLCLRYVRRGRSRISFRDLTHDKITAAAHFCNFVVLYEEKAERKKGTQ